MSLKKKFDDVKNRIKSFKGKEKKISFLSTANLLMFMFLLGAILSPFAGTCSPQKTLADSTDNPLHRSPTITKAEALQNAMREIYKEVNPAVVRIETEQKVSMPQHPFFDDPFFRRFFGEVPEQNRQQTRQGLGSGFVISTDGYIVTNNHVVAKVDKITVSLVNGKSYEAKIVGTDSYSDLALLKIKVKEKLKTVYVGDSDKVEVGDIAIAIGNPFGLSSTFTMGVISSKGQDINPNDPISKIQTDAAINPGNSGGPLLNIKGEVVGINQMIYSQSGGSVGIGFAIPINYAMQIVEKLKEGKTIKPGYIGVASPEATPEELKQLGTKEKGLLVKSVALGSPAYKAGVQLYDLIVKVDGKPSDSFSVLKSTVMKKGPGKEIVLTVIRKGKKLDIAIKIGQQPANNNK